MTHHLADTLAANIAARALAGDGTMTLIPLDDGPAIEVGAHGLDADGNITVICLAETTPDPIEVRMDIVITSPEFDVRIAAASLHARATLEWVRAEGPWLRGTLTAGDLHVHHIGGPTNIPLATAKNLTLAATDTDRLSGYDAVAGLGRGVLSSLIDGSLSNAIPSITAPEQPLRACPHTQHRVFVVDVSSLGVTLLRTTATTRVVVHVELPRPARTPEELSAQLTALSLEAVAARS